jgi:ATP-binding cassette, subfamily C, bacterial CydCD
VIAQPWAFVLGRAAPRLPRLGGAALVSLICVGSGVALLAVSGYLIQDASLRPPILSLDVAAVAVRLFSLLRASGRYLDRLATHDAVLRLLADTRVAVYEAIEPRSPGAFDLDRSGDVMRRIGGDVEALQDVYARSLLPPAVAVLAVLIAALIAGIVAAPIGVTAILVMAGAGVAIVLAATLSARGVAAQLAGLAGTLTAEITDTLQGCADLVGAGAVDRQLARVDLITTRIQRAATRLARSRAIASGLVSLAGGVTVVAVVIAATAAVSAGATPAIATGIVALGAMAMSEPFSLLPAAVDGARTGLPSAQRLVDITTRPLPVIDPLSPQTLPDASDVVLTGVSMRYGPDLPPALDRVSLRLAPGSRIGIEGPSGSGKSSLAAVLVRFREFEEGAFSLGGVDVRELSGDAVRSRIGLVSQDAHIFATSIKENLRLARVDASDEELRAAASGAHLLEWIATLPEGWDTLVGEHGAQISGGQRRRLALARALLAGFPVLIVDEPTEALDDETAAAVMHDIVEASTDRALLVISHRVADMARMDEVHSMHHGLVTQIRPSNSR